MSKEDKKIKEFQEVSKVLGNREWFLMGGAALFAYRDNKFPKNSLGIGVYGRDDVWQDELELTLKELGYKVHNEGTVLDAEKTIKFSFFSFIDYGNRWSCLRSPVGEWLYIPTVFKKLEKIKFKNWKVNVPSPIEDYLLFAYGDKWRDPTQKNHCHPPARQFIKGKYPELE